MLAVKNVAMIPNSFSLGYASDPPPNGAENLPRSAVIWEPSCFAENNHGVWAQLQNPPKSGSVNFGSILS
jgi:hypothetical protein